MRTLKKTLCLVLALVMVLGICAFNAAAFTDDADIKYTEAVNVMKLAGVLDGFDDGSFQPNGTLTRAQAAKMIACMLGYSDISGKTTFKDCQGHWAEGYIALCVKEGIVAGYGDGNFGPEDTLTGSAWAKMVMCAMGYDADYEGFGAGTADWEVAVAKLVKKLGLADAIKGFDGTKAITRDQASEIAFEGMIRPVREFKPGIEITGTGLSVSASGEYKGNITDTEAATPVDGAAPASLLSNLGIVRYDGDEDATDYFGRPLKAYYEDEDEEVVYQSGLKPVVTYTKSTLGTAVEKDLRKYTITSVTAAVNGAEGDAITAKASVFTGAEETTKGISGLTGAGRTVEVYADSDGDITAIVVTFDSLVMISKVDAKNEQVKVLPIAGGTVSTTTIEADDPGYEELSAMAAYDYAVVKTCNGNIVAVVGKAETVTGAVTAKSAASVTVGGKALAIAKDNTAVSALSVNKAVEKVVYLDSTGAAIFAADVAPTTALPAMYILGTGTKVADYNDGDNVNTFKGVNEAGEIVEGTYVVPKTTGTPSAVVDGYEENPAKDNAYHYTKDAYGNYQFMSNVTYGEAVGVAKSGAAAPLTSKSIKLNDVYFASGVKFVYISSRGAAHTITVKEGAHTVSLAENVFVNVVSVANAPRVQTIFVAAAPETVSTDLFFVPYLYKTQTGYNDKGYNVDSYAAYLNGAPATFAVAANADVSSIDVGFHTYAVADATGYYTLGSTVPANTKLGDYTVTVTEEEDDTTTVAVTGGQLIQIDGKYLLTMGSGDTALTDANATGATIVDARVAGTGIDTMAEMLTLFKEESTTFSLGVVFDKTANTVSMVYIYDTPAGE